MPQDQGRTSTDDTTPSRHQEDDGLAQAYQDAASGDAYHQRGAGSAPGEQPVVLVPRKDGEAVPSTDPAPEDKVVLGSHRAPDGAANGSRTVSDEALERGLTPGEMGAGKEPQEKTKARLAPRYTDAELSGIEHGETGDPTLAREPARETHCDVAEGSAKDVAEPETKGATRPPSRFTDAELSGLEPGETSTE